MNGDGGIWGLLTKGVIFLLLLAVLVAVAFWYLPLIQQNERMRKEILRLQAQVNEEEEKGREMRAWIESLQNDPKAVERIAREKLGFARSNETVIRFESPTNRPATNLPGSR
jgi:cell division protein FtsB